MNYELGLDKVTNNQVEFLALFQGLTYLDSYCIKNVLIIGDLDMVTRTINKYTAPIDNKVTRIIVRIQK